MEIWKDLTDYEDLYQVSSYGRFKIKERIVSKGKRGQRLVKERISNGTKCGLKGTDYYVVTLSKKGYKKISKKLHRLIAIEFISNAENKPQVNHIDGNRFNNNVLNLEWATSMENNCHRYIGSNHKSKYHGITFSVKNKKWIARATINKKRYSIGSFLIEIEAHKARVEFLKDKGVVNKYETIHILPPSEKEKAIELYKKMTA